MKCTKLGIATALVAAFFTSTVSFANPESFESRPERQAQAALISLYEKLNYYRSFTPRLGNKRDIGEACMLTVYREWEAEVLNILRTTQLNLEVMQTTLNQSADIMVSILQDYTTIVALRPGFQDVLTAEISRQRNARLWPAPARSAGIRLDQIPVDLYAENLNKCRSSAFLNQVASLIPAGNPGDTLAAEEAVRDCSVTWVQSSEGGVKPELHNCSIDTE